MSPPSPIGGSTESAPAIPGYHLVAKLGEGTQSTIYRGFLNTAPERPLAIKVFRATLLTERQVAHYRQKVEHLRVVSDPMLLTPESFDVRGGVPFVVQDYCGGLPLDEWARRQPAVALDAFFTIACQLATALDKVHEAGIIHGGVKPHNILVDPVTLETRLTGFVTPLDVRDVSHFIFDPAFISGTLAYTSPEQTGRIHHVVVFSSDLYSLGVVFYELLARRLPFRSTDPLALIHQHLAEEAPPVHEVNPEIPAALGRIVAKLTLKQPEKRYQSGRGLFADLVRCRTEWEVSRSIGRFPLATEDRSRRVVFVSKMVGRDAEARAILDAYEPAAQGEFRSVLISGLPGIGKTRLIQELQQPIVRHRGYFTSGKFDIYQKNIPYSSILQALRNLIRTFLTESQERIAVWKSRILEVVGQSGRVLIDVIPELEALIGEQPGVPLLPPVEARNRFHNLFDRFLGCLASAESPLTLFIDDLQWCDVASFDFLQTLFTNSDEHPHLLLIGAYRHNEVDSSHPLAKLVAKAKGDQKPLEEIRLRPLEPKYCHEMVSYILDAPLAHTEALAAFLADLTEGNPLFVSESLSYLYNEDLLYVDDEMQWRWDLERIRRSNMPSTVVALFSAKIDKLGKSTVDLLQTAACMGNTVAPEELARVSDLALVGVFESLKPALGQGLVIENRGNLQFIHDRVQEAVLTAIAPEWRRAIHWQVGHKLLAAVPAGADLEGLDSLFAIVSHLNLGRPAELDRAETWRLADLNFHAGEKALNALATTAASEFFGESKELLPADSWELEYEQTFKIFQKAAKTELMCGRSAQSEALLGDLLEHARTELDKAEALSEQTTSLSSIGNFIRAIDTANSGLAYFGKALPDDPDEAERRRAALMAEIQAKHPDVWNEILHMPFTEDRKSKIELAFYSELIPDLYMSGRVPQLYLSAVQSTQHSLAGGMDESVIYSFSIMGLQLGEQEQFEQAFRYEDLARELAARYPNTFGATRGINGVAWCNMHSRSRPEEIVEYCLRGVQSGKSCGDLYNAGLCYGPLMWNLQVQGADLGTIEEYARECQKFSERNHLSFSVGLAEAMQAGWIAPMKQGYEPADMDERVAQWEKDNHVAAAGSYYAHLALSHYYFGEHDEAAEALAGVSRYLSGLTDNVLKRQWYVFRALNALRLHECRLAAGARPDAVLVEIEPFVAKVETWARLGPLLKPYLAFLHAERERVTGQFERARGLYLEAIDCAHAERYVFLEGHLNECLGEMLLAGGRGQSGPFLLEALRLYRCCRAERKELRLRDRHPELVEAYAPLDQPPRGRISEPPPADTYALPELDVGYLMRSALAISAEIEEEALLRRIMQTVVEASGAQHGYLLVAEDGHLRVRAESHAGPDERVGTDDRRLEDSPDLCSAVVRFVYRTGQRLVLADASEEGEFRDNPQVRALGLRSVLCLPVVKQGGPVGVLYLENRLAPAMFTPTGVQTTELLAAQAAISLENARLLEEMKRAENTLARERERLAVTLHSIGDAVIATDTTSRLTMLNRVGEELTGFTQAEGSGKPLAEIFRIVNEQTGEPAEDPVRKVLDSGAVVGLANHTALIARDGSQRAIADSAAPIRGPGGETLGVVLVFRDVTMARKAEQERDATIELLRIVNVSPDARALMAAVTDFFQRQSGCEAVGVRLEDGCDYPYYETRGLSQEFVLAERRLCEVDDAGNLARDGDGNPVLECMCGNVIRGRCNPEKPFFTARGSFWTNSTTHLLATTIDADRQARTRNRCHGEGYESVALVPLQFGEERLGLIQLSDRRQGLFSPEKVALWERLAGHVAVGLAKFRAEEALRESEGALKDADRRKNDFLAVLSHELRNPLTPIRNSLFTLERAIPGREQAKRAQAIIERQVGHMSRLVDDLLDVTRITRGKIQIQRERLELGEVARRTIEDHRQTFVANGIALDSRLTSEPLWLCADPTRMAQVVGNLLGNAAKFTPRGGKVEVRLERDGGSVVLRVRDDGEGIEAEVLRNLFQPFSQARQTLDRSRGGLGLGLALVRSLAELHGGTAEATSKGLGQGAEFTVRLPLEPPRSGRTAAPKEGHTFHPRRLLVIEDNVDAADSLKEALELIGHEVAVAYDGVSGLAAARQFRPEVLLCDIGLPRMDGYEVARAFRADEKLQGALLVALTGYALPEDLQRAQAAGFVQHLAKPPSIEQLEALLGNLGTPAEPAK